MNAKSLMWCVASILRSVLFIKTAELRKKDRKSFTIPAIFDLLEPIKAHRDPRYRRYKRDFTLVDKQKQLLKALKISEKNIEEEIEKLWP